MELGELPACRMSEEWLSQAHAPQMRLQLLENSIRLRDEERLKFCQLAKELCASAVEYAGDGRSETKIDIDALDPSSFLQLDVQVRRMLSVAAAASAARSTAM